MKNILVITDHREISTVNDIIHDCLFEKDKITFDHRSSTLEIKFNYESQERKTTVRKILFLKKISVPIIKYILRISNVETYHICEDSQEGPGDDDYFDVIMYDPQEKLIRIKTIIAQAIDIKVTKLDLLIVDSCEQVGEKICFRL
jgi:hypothetical protein